MTQKDPGVNVSWAEAQRWSAEAGAEGEAEGASGHTAPLRLGSTRGVPSDFVDQFEGRGPSTPALGSPGSGGAKAMHNTRILRGPAHVHCGGPTLGGRDFPIAASTETRPERWVSRNTRATSEGCPSEESPPVPVSPETPLRQRGQQGMGREGSGLSTWGSWQFLVVANINKAGGVWENRGKAQNLKTVPHET